MNTLVLLQFASKQKLFFARGAVKFFSLTSFEHWHETKVPFTVLQIMVLFNLEQPQGDISTILVDSKITPVTRYWRILNEARVIYFIYYYNAHS